MEILTTVPAKEKASCAMPEVFQLIEELQKRFVKFQTHILKEAGLTLPQYYILSLLSVKDGRPFKELATELACTRATVTGIVDTLEKKGLVARKPHLDDRRSMLVNLTEGGRHVLQVTPDLEQAFGSCCCEMLQQEENQVLIFLLKKISASLPF